jgi:zinc transport system permease protein
MRTNARSVRGYSVATSLDGLGEIFSYGFMLRAMLVGILLSVFSGLISVFVVLRKVSFLGSGISHAAFGGLAIGFLLGLNPLIMAFVYSLLIALGIEQLSNRGKLAEDTAIGIFFSSSMALGIVLIGLSQRYNVDLFGYLFGSILAIGEEEAFFAMVVFFLLTTIIFAIRKELYLITFNEELAFVTGIKIRLIRSLFLLSMAVGIVLGIKMVGVILISALLIIPGATAQVLTKSFSRMIFISCSSSFCSTLFGLILAYLFNLAPGGTIVLLMSLIFFVVFWAAKR